MSIPEITLNGTFTDAAGDPMTGTLSFRLNAPLVDSVGNVVSERVEIVSTLNDAGQITDTDGTTVGLTLYCTSGGDIAPAGLVYDVKVEVGSRPHRVSVALPDSLGATVDWADLVPVPASTGVVWTVPDLTAEQARDLVGSTLVAGDGLSKTVDDAGDTVTLDIDTPYTTDEQTKLAGIEDGAQVNTVDSVDGQTGAVDLSGTYVAFRLYDADLAAYPPRSDAVVEIDLGPVQPVDWNPATDLWFDTSEPLVEGNTDRWEILYATATAVATITLGTSPNPMSETVYRNGVVQRRGVDYTITSVGIITISLTALDEVMIHWSYPASETPNPLDASQDLIILSHAFTAADSVNTVPVADIGGYQGAALSGTWGISSNQLYLSTATGADQYVFDVGAYDCTVQVKLAAVGSSGGLCVRAVDTSNSFISSLTGFFRRQAGVNNQIISYSQTFVAGDSMRVVMAGETFTVYRDAGTTGSWVQVGTNATAQTFQKTATKHGVRAGSGGTSFRFDDLKVFV